MTNLLDCVQGKSPGVEALILYWNPNINYDYV